MKGYPTIPFDGYANAYEYTHIDVLGREHKEILLGEPCVNIEDLPNFYEYDNVAHRYLGKVKVKIEKEEKE